MKNCLKILYVTLFSAILSSCVTTTRSGSAAVTDDLYGKVDRTQVAREVAAQKQRQYERDKLREQIANAQAAEEAYYEIASTGNPYDDVLSDSYEESYARRLKGFQSPTYRMPSSYYNYLYGDAAWYASAYDNAFYNTIVMGDEVWVEPKYITSMFGTWGRPVVNINMQFGRPYWNNWGCSSWYNPYWCWESRYWPSWNYGWYDPYWGHNHYPGYYPGNHYPGYHPGNSGYTPRNVVYGGRRGGSVGTESYGTGTGNRREPININQSRPTRRPVVNTTGSESSSGKGNQGYSREELLRRRQETQNKGNSNTTTNTNKSGGSFGSGSTGSGSTGSGTGTGSGGSRGGGNNRGRR